MDSITAIVTRSSVRSFLKENVPDSIIEKLIDCGRMAATARNEQPWEFIVVKDKQMLERIGQIATNGKFISEAPLCLAIFSQDTKYYVEDCSAATQNILIASHALGFGSCWVAGDKKEYAEEIGKLLGVPEGIKLVSLIAIGKPVEVKPRREKRSLIEVIHWEKY